MDTANLTAQLKPLMEKIEQLSLIQRFLVCLVAVVALGALYYFLIAQPILDDIQAQKSQHQSLTQRLNTAKSQAAQLPRLRKEKEMKKAEFKKATNALPENQEIPALLTSISQLGQETGVIFESFEPKKEKIIDFYAEIPVSITMTGEFHNIVRFFDEVTSMNRVVNFRDIHLKNSGKTDQLSASCQAVTYKFVEKKQPKIK